MPQNIGGHNAVLEALRSGFPVFRLMLASGAQPGSVDDLLRAAKDRAVEVQWLERQLLDRMVPESHGAAAKVGAFRYGTFDDLLELIGGLPTLPLILLLDGIQDPHNLGSLLRTAEVAGVHAVVIPQHRAAGLTPAVARVSAGAVFYLPVFSVNNLVRAIDLLKQRNVWITGLEADGAEEYHQVDFTEPTGIVVGSEGQGLGRLVREHCDRLVKLPVCGHINSLNAAVAGGIVLYEARRQRSLTQLV
jgi:23S rRNA (guanosine2251-2'-O)-methyltransferase